MVEVTLYSIDTGSTTATVGKCIDRARLDKEAMGIGVMEFVKGFLKTNLHEFEHSLRNDDISEFINSNRPLRLRDLASINYFLAKVGFMIQIQNVADDEENALSVPSETIEWNVIDYNYMQYDYPTATKIIPADGSDIVSVLEKIIENLDFFDTEALGRVRNPLKDYLDKLKKIKEIKGSIEPGITTKIYEVLDSLGVKIFCATGE